MREEKEEESEERVRIETEEGRRERGESED